MPFQKNHKFGAKKILNQSLDKHPISFKGYEGQKEKLKLVPDWQEKLRLYVNRLIAENGS